MPEQCGKGKIRRFYRALFCARGIIAVSCFAIFLWAYSRPRSFCNDFAGYLLNFQFSARAVGVGATAGAVLIFLMAAFAAGRIFCSAFCPMGALQELLWRVSGALKISRGKYISPRKIRYIVPLVSAAGIIAVVRAMFIIPDPISNFGRGILGISLVLEGVITPQVLASVAFFLVIASAAFWRGRRFCDWCPVGTVLGFASFVAPMRLALDSHGCVSCGLCEKSCPMNCVDASGKKIDSDRCVLCMGCASVCPGEFIRFGRRGSPAPDGRRRNFIKRACAFIIGAGYLGGRNMADLARGIDVRAKVSREAASFALPPGALSEEYFSSRCVACQMCVKSCPVGIIRADDAPQPVVVYGTDYCQFNCVECGKVCPTNAITRLDVETKRVTRIGLSRLTLSRCVVVTKLQACGACAEVCPTHALRMERYEGNPGLTIPVFDKDYCIGCGACLCVCPADPTAFGMTGVSPQIPTLGMRTAAYDEGDEDGGVRPMTSDDDFPF
jgi:ferredoxin